MNSSESFIACSSCFTNEGLRLDAERVGETDPSPCPRCSSVDGRKFTSAQLATLAERFFVWGSVLRCDYGAFPLVQFNHLRRTEIAMPRSLSSDVALFEAELGVGFFYYGPRLWMAGEIEPLKRLQREESRGEVIDRILREYGVTKLTNIDRFYRIRKCPKPASDVAQYDSGPAEHPNGRLDAPQRPVLYASPDLQTCIHECRATAEDDLYVATLQPSRELTLLNVATLLEEERGVDEFESLDLAVNMLFLAGENSYPIAREIAWAARRAGFDGLVYPSYFSMLRNGVKPIETTLGMSRRRIPEYKEFEASKISWNLAVFGRPIQDELIEVACINRVVLSSVHYSVHFGPVVDDDQVFRPIPPRRPPLEASVDHLGSLEPETS